MYQNVQSYVINPKSMKIEELFGEISLESQEWIDGIASCIIRQCAYEDNEGYN